MGERKANIGSPGFSETSRPATGFRSGGLLFGSEQLETLLRQSRVQSLFVRKMPVNRGGRHADHTGEFAQGWSFSFLPFQRAQSGSDKGVMQIPMMIGRR